MTETVTEARWGTLAAAFAARLREPEHQRAWRGLAFLAITLLTYLLYTPYLGNPLIFDDANIFHTGVITRAAIAPWELGTRGLPYFTLGWVETQIGDIRTHRLIGLALHILVAYHLLRFLETALGANGGGSGPDQQPVWKFHRLALLVALLFVCHPVAVYGAGYLVQRTIVMATLFSLLCLRCLLGALMQNKAESALAAAGWASLAILCKEHAVLLPVAALSVALLARRPLRGRMRLGMLFFIFCLPAMTYAMQSGLYAVGHTYEPGMQSLASERYGLPPFTNASEQWLFSVLTQMRLYVGYWLQWLLPDPAKMSIDLRVDFLEGWSPAQAWLAMAGFVAVPLVAAILALRSGKFQLIAFALAFTAVLASIEFASIRFQEPYVLYRSYLWSIGYCSLFAALLSLLPVRLATALTVLVILLLFYQASGRLASMSSARALWEDAGSKLEKTEVAGASRILFNRGGERFKAGDMPGAMSDINQAIYLGPVNGDYRIARAVALLKQGQPYRALADVEVAQLLLPGNSNVLFTRYRVLNALGRTAEAEESLASAARLGHYGAKYELARRLSTNGEVTVVN